MDFEFNGTAGPRLHWPPAREVLKDALSRRQSLAGGATLIACDGHGEQRRGRTRSGERGMGSWSISTRELC